jgi:hypothetical protein
MREVLPRRLVCPTGEAVGTVDLARWMTCRRTAPVVCDPLAERLADRRVPRHHQQRLPLRKAHETMDTGKVAA